jgi:hypothetical protein
MPIPYFPTHPPWRLWLRSRAGKQASLPEKKSNGRAHHMSGGTSILWLCYRTIASLTLELGGVQIIDMIIDLQ